MRAFRHKGKGHCDGFNMLFQKDFVNDSFMNICSYMQQLISDTNLSPEDAVQCVHGFHP